MADKQVVVGFLGSQLDRGRKSRWEHWRPTVAMFQHPDMLIDRLELLVDPRFSALAAQVCEDIHSVSPKTEIQVHDVACADPWDFEEVYESLFAFTKDYPFDPEAEDYLVHITTGSHVQQICLFLLVESRAIPGRLLQTAPPKRSQKELFGSRRIIDLDLARYDRIAQRYAAETKEALNFLKQGIETQNASFNKLMERVERVVLRSDAPILLTGPTGAGKTQLARRIFELKSKRGLVRGKLVELNCATLRGDQAMSALFGHKRGAFTGALSDRPGLLRQADKGLLFLDEIGELGVDEQAMLLRALELGRFLPVGSDREVESKFSLIAGTNQDLGKAVREGRFREDLLARINLWSFALPGLAMRPEDIEPNLDFELERVGATLDRRVTMNKEARGQFLRFALQPDSVWRGNFRDLNAAVTRMATLATGSRIDSDVVREEREGLKKAWASLGADGSVVEDERYLNEALAPEALADLDPFDRVQLAYVLKICAQSRTLSEAGRRLFAVSRQKRSSRNDADRIRKYLARFSLRWDELPAKQSD